MTVIVIVIVSFRRSWTLYDIRESGVFGKIQIQLRESCVCVVKVKLSLCFN